MVYILCMMCPIGTISSVLELTVHGIVIAPRLTIKVYCVESRQHYQEYNCPYSATFSLFRLDLL